MTFEEFSTANLQRCEAANGFDHQLEDWSISDWMVATLGELGEAANVIKKLNRYRDGVGVRRNKQTKEQLEQMLKDEIGDTGIYLDLLCRRAGFTLEEAMRDKFNQVSDEIGCPIKV